MRQNNIPLFFEDNSENLDHELLLDYFLGWTLRCAQEGNQDEKVRLAAKGILAYILSENLDKYKIKEVKTWKQWNQIDLCAEIILAQENLEERKIAILFEDKMYTHLREGQLKKYKKVFDEYYRSAENGKTDYELKYRVLTCHNDCKELQSDMDEAKEHGFTLLKWHELKTGSGLNETGNFMFDEFWFEYFK
jgi:hypothetical protein